ncbi:unnamed protein product [Notodromas monacha]|uniref:Cyclin C-terminal domain-containing protein n=1 Tax=Notodromas monacha TaxID=399045 RepID=A0A7R9BUP2_9CRUS|nr:unnamed protein product [Notodromas monacha]CAG0920994.1 unnamed protein product [Notodromas monacha]
MWRGSRLAWLPSPARNYTTASRDVPKSQLQLSGATALFIAAKLEEVMPPRAQDFAYVTEGACTEDEILLHQRTMNLKLGFPLYPLTANTWLDLFLQIGTCRKGKVEELPTIPNALPSDIVELSRLIEFSLMDLRCHQFSYRHVAASAIYLPKNAEMVIRVSGLKYEDLKECITFMEPFFDVILQNGPAKCHFFENYPRKTANVLQTKNTNYNMVELSILFGTRAQVLKNNILKMVKKRACDGEVKKPTRSPGVMRFHGQVIDQKMLLKFVWALQTRGYERLDQVGIDLGFKPGEAQGILQHLASRIKKQDLRNRMDVYSVSTFPEHYDEICEMLHQEHLKRSGQSANLSSNAYAEVLDLAAKYGRFPVPKDCGGVDYKVICSYLASCLRGNPPPELSIESSSALLKATKKMQNSANNASAFRDNLVKRVEEALDKFRGDQNERPSEAEQDLLEPEPEFLDATGCVGDEVLAALAASPGLNPLRMPVEEIKLL